ncbi:complement receptor type 1-like [Erythrolamprus reginae]|uniref:complement receptor type 1-like n=1 Tax=Erythrolamprus reginae TaxID=121349 RepID=UPI00396CF84C
MQLHLQPEQDVKLNGLKPADKELKEAHIGFPSSYIFPQQQLRRNKAKTFVEDINMSLNKMPKEKTSASQLSFPPETHLCLIYWLLGKHFPLQFYIPTDLLSESEDVSPSILMGLSSCSNVVLTVVLVLQFLSSTVLSDCPRPTLPPHSRLRSEEALKDSYVVGTSLRLTCISGYEFIPRTRPILTCNADSTWSKLTELCQGKRCPVPHLENGRIVSSGDLRLGETVTLECDDGFRLIGQATLRCVLRGGEVKWNRELPYCERIPCARPAIISNGRYDADSADTYVVGSSVTYRCDADYSLIGNSTITCIVAADGKNGQWNSPSPECKKVNCAKPSIPNGKLATLYKPSYTYGDRVTLECNPGFTLVGTAWIRCDADNTWKPSLPRCDKTVATTKPTKPPIPAPPVPPVPVPPLPPIVPIPPPVPPEVDETTFIPMPPTQRKTIPTVDSGSGSGSESESGNIVGIIVGIIFTLLVLAALIFAAVRWWNQRKANAPDNSQVASEKERTMGNQNPQQVRSKTLRSVQRSALEFGEVTRHPHSSYHNRTLISLAGAKCQCSMALVCQQDEVHLIFANGTLQDFGLRDVLWICKARLSRHEHGQDPNTTENESEDVSPSILMGLYSCSNVVLTVVLVLQFLSSTVLSDCPRPTLPPHSRLKSEEALKDSYVVGTSLRLTCIPGYELIPRTRPILKCNADSTWTRLTELCQGKRCPVPHLENGRIASSGDLRLGDTVTLECDDGFRLIGQATLRCVLRGGEVNWNRELPYCERIPCARPAIISNGRYDADSADTYVVGSSVTYRCDADYSLIGNSTITCIVAADGKNGQWNSPSPECKKVNCAKPSIPNGKLATLYKPSYTYGDRVTLECNPGFTLVGTAWIRCDADNTWKPSLPRCDKTVATTKPTKPPIPAPPVPPVPVPPLPPIVPIPPPVPPEVDETTFIPMPPTQRKTIPTVDSGSGSGSESESGNIVGIVVGIIFTLLVLAALIFAAVRWWNQRKANAPDNSQVASEKERTMGNQNPQQVRSKTLRSVQRSALEFGEVTRHPNSSYHNRTLISLAGAKCQCSMAPESEDVSPGIPMGLSSFSNVVLTVVLVPLFLSSTVLCDCPRPTLPPHSQLRGGEALKDSYIPGILLNLECIPGYEFIPDPHPYLVCYSDSTWKGEPKLCQGKRCPVPHLENGRIALSDDLRLGETATLECNYGFRLIGEDTLQCVLTGGEVKWNRELPYCEQIPCARPAVISNGRYDADPTDTYVAGSSVIYRCDADYSLIGNSTITCIVAADGKNGQWNSPSPECKKVNCAKPSIPNGKLATLSKPSYTYGDRVTLECNPGFTLVGTSWIRCDADNTWKPSLPRCDKTVATTKPTEPPIPVPPVPPVPVPPVTHIVPIPPPIPPTLVPPEVDETTSIPMSTTQRKTIPTVDSGLGSVSGSGSGSGSESGSGKTVGIIFGIISALLVLAALIFVAMRRRNQRKANAPDNSQVASEKEKPKGDQRPQQLRSNTSRPQQLRSNTSRPQQLRSNTSRPQQLKSTTSRPQQPRSNTSRPQLKIICTYTLQISLRGSLAVCLEIQNLRELPRSTKCENRSLLSRYISSNLALIGDTFVSASSFM